jgi:hypothetical protein
MKPAPQISSNQRERQNFPLTDYQFQSTVDPHATTTATQQESISELRTFRKLSSDFLGTEANREYLTELLFFTLIVVVSAWRIILTIVDMTHMVWNY